MNILASIFVLSYLIAAGTAIMLKRMVDEATRINHALNQENRDLHRMNEMLLSEMLGRDGERGPADDRVDSTLA